MKHIYCRALRYQCGAPRAEMSMQWPGSIRLVEVSGQRHWKISYGINSVYSLSATLDIFFLHWHDKEMYHIPFLGI